MTGNSRGYSEIAERDPEYREGMKRKAGPKIVVGSDKRRAGKIFVDMTGGTSGARESYEKLALAGVGTIVGMHMGEDHRKEAEKTPHQCSHCWPYGQ